MKFKYFFLKLRVVVTNGNPTISGPLKIEQAFSVNSDIPPDC